MSVILATQEADIRRIMVQSQSKTNRHISKKPNTKQGWWSGSSGRVYA
jgi:hypothetical protein